MADPTNALLDYLRKIGADLDGDFLREDVQLPWTVRPPVRAPPWPAGLGRAGAGRTG